MDAIEALMNRNSVPAKLLNEPAPEGKELEEILETGMRAPDHAGLKPWRFLIIRGEARERLGDVMAEAMARCDITAGPERLDDQRKKPLRSPLIIAICAEVTPNHPKAPEIEQIITVSAAAQNILNAAHAKGYGGIMLTGPAAHDEYVKGALGLEKKDQIICFLYLGTPQGEVRAKPRPAAMDFVVEWTGDVRGAKAAE
jgi:nitroreductase